ncbi:MAG: hypothetical protein CEO21_68 [Microgenomates group bacterium Gr01-1014_80]|nr:MAG: hypothetical protein CEO21_68 [Microgenomates group bacterium Gr01-1014_80]
MTTEIEQLPELNKRAQSLSSIIDRRRTLYVEWTAREDRFDPSNVSPEIALRRLRRHFVMEDILTSHIGKLALIQEQVQVLEDEPRLIAKAQEWKALVEKRQAQSEELSSYRDQGRISSEIIHHWEAAFLELYNQPNNDPELFRGLQLEQGGRQSQAELKQPAEPAPVEPATSKESESGAKPLEIRESARNVLYLIMDGTDLTVKEITELMGRERNGRRYSWNATVSSMFTLAKILAERIKIEAVTEEDLKAWQRIKEYIGKVSETDAFVIRLALKDKLTSWFKEKLTIKDQAVQVGVSTPEVGGTGQPETTGEDRQAAIALGINWRAQLGAELEGGRIVYVDGLELPDFDGGEVQGSSALFDQEESKRHEYWGDIDDQERFIPMRSRHRSYRHRRKPLLRRVYMAADALAESNYQAIVPGNISPTSPMPISAITKFNENAEEFPRGVTLRNKVIRSLGSLERAALIQILVGEGGLGERQLSEKLFGLMDGISIRRTKGLIRRLNGAILSSENLSIILVDGEYAIEKRNINTEPSVKG